jgi:hypothetical protein
MGPSRRSLEISNNHRWVQSVTESEVAARVGEVVKDTFCTEIAPASNCGLAKTTTVDQRSDQPWEVYGLELLQDGNTAAPAGENQLSSPNPLNFNTPFPSTLLLTHLTHVPSVATQLAPLTKFTNEPIHSQPSHDPARITIKR